MHCKTNPKQKNSSTSTAEAEQGCNTEASWTSRCHMRVCNPPISKHVLSLTPSPSPPLRTQALHTNRMEQELVYFNLLRSFLQQQQHNSASAR